MTRHILLIATSVVSAAAGAVAGYYISRKRLEAEYAAIAEQEIADAKVYYGAMYKKDEFETPEKAVEALISEERVREQLTGVIREGRYGNPAEVDRTSPRRIPGEPYIISDDEFTEDGDYDSVALTYYAGDNTLANDQDEIVDDPDATVGLANLERFGFRSGDENVVYIRNERHDTDYVVTRSEGKYSEEVAGFIDEKEEGPELPKYEPRRRTS